LEFCGAETEYIGSTELEVLSVLASHGQRYCHPAALCSVTSHHHASRKSKLSGYG
jgi:hypothetical protein